MPKFKKGDRVTYVGKSRESHRDFMVGKSGTVVEWCSKNWVSVNYDDGATNDSCYEENLEFAKENKMSDDVVTLKKEDLQKAYAAGCSDVKRVLDGLYPGQTKPKEEWENVGDRVVPKWNPSNIQGHFLELWLDGEEFGYASGASIDKGAGVHILNKMVGRYRFSFSGDTIVVEKRVD